MTKSEPTVISMAVKMANISLAQEGITLIYAVAETFRDAAGEQPIEDWIVNKRLGDVIGSVDEEAVNILVEKLFDNRLDFLLAVRMELHLNPNEVVPYYIGDEGYMFTRPETH